MALATCAVLAGSPLRRPPARGAGASLRPEMAVVGLRARRRAARAAKAICRTRPSLALAPFVALRARACPRVRTRGAARRPGEAERSRARSGLRGGRGARVARSVPVLAPLALWRAADGRAAGDRARRGCARPRYRRRRGRLDALRAAGRAGRPVALVRVRPRRRGTSRAAATAPGRSRRGACRLVLVRGGAAGRHVMSHVDALVAARRARCSRGPRASRRSTWAG